VSPLRLVIITDVDGTLIDQATYSYADSLPAVSRLLSLQIPLVLCSSKTRAEMLRLWKELHLQDPFIVENGGAICVPPRYFPFALRGFNSAGSFPQMELGTRVSKLREVLLNTALQCAVKVRFFGSMRAEEIAELTGLTKDQAALAGKREYGEPFLIEGNNEDKFVRALIGKGFGVTRGERFFYVTGNHDKGTAAKILLDLYRRIETKFISVGLGNSANDFPLFCQVDRPVLIRKSDGTWDSEIIEKLPFIERTDAKGPLGWREAIESVVATTAKNP
jgi:mannosyl-3-phosphoglycerate phosphatase family protein